MWSETSQDWALDPQATCGDWVYMRGHSLCAKEGTNLCTSTNWSDGYTGFSASVTCCLWDLVCLVYCYLYNKSCRHFILADSGPNITSHPPSLSPSLLWWTVQGPPPPLPTIFLTFLLLQFSHTISFLCFSLFSQFITWRLVLHCVSRHRCHTACHERAVYFIYFILFLWALHKRAIRFICCQLIRPP